MQCTRRDMLKMTAAAAIGSAMSSLFSSVRAEETVSAISPNRLLLWYRQPADIWTDALPVGNGHLGAMVFGGVAKERLQLNGDTLWSGPPPKDWNNPDARQYLPQVRHLLMDEGKYAEANELTKKMQGPFNESFQPMGYLNLQFAGSDEATDYRRELDLETAVVKTTYAIGSARYTREIFASAPDQVIVIKLSCDQPGRVTFVAGMESLLKAFTVSVPPGGLALRGRCPRHVEPNYVQNKPEAQTVIYEDPDGHAMRFEAAIKVVVTGGTVSAGADGLSVQSADSAIVYLAAATGYRGFQHPPNLTVEQIARKCRKQLSAAAAKPYPKILADHVADYQQLFRRVSLSLGANPAPDIPTDQRIEKLRSGDADPQFAALYYQYSRYLLIACSRPGSQPANLQGMWNDLVRPPWSSNWTININTQMNYWHAESGNLSECHEPLVDLVAKLAANGKKTAEVYYGLGGWVAHHNVDLWAQAPPVGESRGNPKWSNWPMGGAWLCLHLWEHYAFNQDREYLRKRAYPLMKGAAEFMLGWLIEDGKGHLVTCPSVSPENEFISPKDGKSVAVSVASTMDMAIIWNLFTNCIESCRILGVDSKFRGKLEAARARLLPYQIGSFGQLQEWSQDYHQARPTGHCSHLFPFYPGNQITLRGAPKLAEAVRVAVQRRLADNVGTGGWPCAWYSCLLARLEDAEGAYGRLQSQFKRSAATNLFNGRKVFQIDGNMGIAAAISEMLLQSHTDEIHLLPALPGAWAVGSVAGLKARGGFEVDMQWKDGSLVAATLRSHGGGNCKVRYDEKVVDLAIAPNSYARLNGKLETI